MVRLAKAMVFAVVMYGYESWTIKKAECRRIDAFFFFSNLLFFNFQRVSGIMLTHTQTNFIGITKYNDLARYMEI